MCRCVHVVCQNILPGTSEGLNFIDSIHNKVCYTRCIYQHRAFKDTAERGQCPIGWYYGFKLYLIVNDKGEILSFHLANDNADDRNRWHMMDMTKDIFGKLYENKGSIPKTIADLFWDNGIQMTTNEGDEPEANRQHYVKKKSDY